MNTTSGPPRTERVPAKKSAGSKASSSRSRPGKGPQPPISAERGKAATKARSRDAKGATKSKDFKQAKTKAEEYLKDPKKAKKLASDASKKADRQSSGPIMESIGYLKALIRLVAAYAKGEYRAIPWETIVLAAAAVLYFVSPVDFIPDVLPVIGLTDDAVVVGFVVSLIKNDLDEFTTWEEGR